MRPTSPTSQIPAARAARLDYVPLRSITESQAARAILQLRERSGRPASEQLCAVLRALNVVVIPDPRVPSPR